MGALLIEKALKALFADDEAFCALRLAFEQ